MQQLIICPIHWRWKSKWGHVIKDSILKHKYKPGQIRTIQTIVAPAFLILEWLHWRMLQGCCLGWTPGPGHSSSLSSGSQAGAPGDLDVSPSRADGGDCSFHLSRLTWYWGLAHISGTHVHTHGQTDTHTDTQTHTHTRCLHGWLHRCHRQGTAVNNTHE